MRIVKIAFVSIIVLSFSSQVLALPIDIHGVFGVDRTSINDYRRIESNLENAPHASVPTTTPTNSQLGSMEVPLQSGSSGNAAFESYIFKISPVLIINDSASFITEYNAGYGRGGRLGSQSSAKPNPLFDPALIMSNTAKSEMTKFYLEFYTDTATWLIGRHTSDWALGAVINSGEELWSRNTYIRDGITMKLKFGNFQIEPYYAKTGSADSLTRATSETEFGGSLLYNDVARDIALGVLFAKKSSGTDNDDLTANMDFDENIETLGETSITLIDIYMKKSLGDLTFAVEVPLLSGELGKVYGASSVDYKAKAILLEATYDLSNNWKLGLNAGTISGDDGSQTAYGAMYLHPNYQVANLMFRYNMAAIANPNEYSIYDSYMTNATYAKFFATYTSDRWRFNTAFIWGQADKVAGSSGNAHNHLYNNNFASTVAQESDLGFEVDFDIDYRWNQEINLGASIGYHFVGDYYAYTNDATKPNEAKNAFSLVIRSSIKF